MDLLQPQKKQGLIYTEELGWIDLGHAQGNDARRLKKKLEQEQWATYSKEFNDWYFPVNYYQEMGKGKTLFGINLAFHTGVHTQVMVRACLSPALKARVALTIMYGTAKRFEAWQNSVLFNWYTDSGFSVEDLVSNLVGFYRCSGSQKARTRSKKDATPCCVAFYVNYWPECSDLGYG